MLRSLGPRWQVSRMITALRAALAQSPPSLSRRERLIVLMVTAVVAVSRWPALSRTLWDWDEALFALAVRDYDVSSYHPHPPGFPLFIAAAKLIPLDPFHALQAIVFVSSLFVFPIAFLLARELRAGAFVATGSALLLAFLPNVWVYGGTALSDVPSMTLSMLAAALLLRGCRGPGSLFAGALVLGIAAGVRPQNLIIGAAPFVIVALCRIRLALLASLLTATVVLVSYGGAAQSSGGWETYVNALEHHQRYIRDTDSFLSPIRPSLLRVADDFFVRPFRAPAINVTLTLLILGGLWRRRPHTVTAVAIFGPLAIFAWLFLDFHSASRFSVGYMPLYAIAAADGVDLGRRLRAPLLSLVVILMIVWTVPALRVVHTTASPPVAAVEWIRENRPPGAVVHVDERLGAHAALLLPEYDRREERSTSSGSVLVREGRGTITFSRPRRRLAGIVRDRYFEVGIVVSR